MTHQLGRLNETSNQNEPQTYTRRNFLALAGATGTLLTAVFFGLRSLEQKYNLREEINSNSLREIDYPEPEDVILIAEQIFADYPEIPQDKRTNMVSSLLPLAIVTWMSPEVQNYEFDISQAKDIFTSYDKNYFLLFFSKYVKGFELLGIHPALGFEISIIGAQNITAPADHDAVTKLLTYFNVSQSMVRRVLLGMNTDKHQLELQLWSRELLDSAAGRDLLDDLTGDPQKSWLAKQLIKRGAPTQHKMIMPSIGMATVGMQDIELLLLAISKLKTTKALSGPKHQEYIQSLENLREAHLDALIQREVYLTTADSFGENLAQVIPNLTENMIENTLHILGISSKKIDPNYLLQFSPIWSEYHQISFDVKGVMRASAITKIFTKKLLHLSRNDVTAFTRLLFSIGLHATDERFAAFISAFEPSLNGNIYLDARKQLLRSAKHQSNTEVKALRIFGQIEGRTDIEQAFALDTVDYINNLIDENFVVPGIDSTTPTLKWKAIAAKTFLVGLLRERPTTKFPGEDFARHSFVDLPYTYEASIKAFTKLYQFYVGKGNYNFDSSGKLIIDPERMVDVVNRIRNVIGDIDIIKRTEHGEKVNRDYEILQELYGKRAAYDFALFRSLSLYFGMLG